MNMNRNRMASLSMAVLMAAGSLCMAQADPRPLPGAATPPAPVPPPAPDMPGHMMGGPTAETDRQARQQLEKIAQQKDNLTADRLCVLNLALGGQFEVAYAKQAQQKSQDANVKKIAQRLVEDHTQANQKLSVVAQKLQVEPPMGLTSMKQKELDILGSLDSKAYDQEFLAMNDAHHAHDVTALRHVAAHAQSPELRQFAAQTLPTLQEHWQMIRQSQTAMGGMTNTDDAQPAGGKVQGTTPRNDTPNAPENRSDPVRPQSGQNPPAPPTTPGARGDVVPSTPGPDSNTPSNRPDPTRQPSGQNPPGSGK